MVGLVLGVACATSVTPARIDGHAVQGTDGVAWDTWAPGFDVATPRIPGGSGGDDVATLVRVDPAVWRLGLYARDSAGLGVSLTVSQWCERLHLVAAVNAGMYLRDGVSHHGSMGLDGVILGELEPTFHAYALFGAKVPVAPEFAILDVEDPAVLPDVTRAYRGWVQTPRLMRAPGEVMWGPETTRHSEVALGEDDEGRAVFVFVSSPWTLRELSFALIALDVGIVRLVHLEGGPPAQVHANVGGHTLDARGSVETGFVGDADRPQPIPFVIGVAPR